MKHLPAPLVPPPLLQQRRDLAHHLLHGRTAARRLLAAQATAAFRQHAISNNKNNFTKKNEIKKRNEHNNREKIKNLLNEQGCLNVLIVVEIAVYVLDMLILLKLCNTRRYVVTSL